MIWPFFPNWKSGYTETFAYRTEVITSDSGREQRRAWRQKARRTVAYEGVAHGSRMSLLRRFLIDRGNPVTFPDEVQRAQVLTTATGSEATFATPLPDWMAPGRQVIFEARGSRDREVRTIGSVSGGTVTFTASSARTWSSGSRVMPALTGTLQPSVRLAVDTDSVGRFSVELIVEPGTEFEVAGLPARTFGGLEVLTHRPNWIEKVEITSADPTEWVDFDMGVRTPYRSVAFANEVSRRTHVVTNADQLDQIKGLFHRARGRQGEFYVPSWTHDIPLSASVSQGATQFITPGHDFHDAYAADTTRRCFSVRMPDRSLAFFRIASMAKSTSGPDRTIITTTAAAAAPIPVSAVISWMPVCRFATDELSIGWQTDSVAEIVVNLQTLEDLP